MKKLLQLCLLIFFLNGITSQLYAQELYQYFDGADTIPEFSITIDVDSTLNNSWQIGPPQKQLFDQASTLPNALITDTIEYYPLNDSSRFHFDLPYQDGIGWGILQLNWMQKLDLDSANDFGIIEYSMDGGQLWNNVVDDPYVYSYYGYDEENLMMNEDLEYGFSGSDLDWKNVWLCLDASWLSEMDSLSLRFRMDADSIETFQEGWMIDDMMLYNGVIHTVNEESVEDYMEITPNPTTGRIQINTQKIEGYHIIEKMELVDNKGAIVKEFGLSPTKFHIDIGEFNAGIYYLKVKTNIVTKTFRILLQKD